VQNFAGHASSVIAYEMIMRPLRRRAWLDPVPCLVRAGGWEFRGLTGPASFVEKSSLPVRLGSVQPQVDREGV
jgi:hypothetical protein